jgi:hypothetical protein
LLQREGWKLVYVTNNNIVFAPSYLDITLTREESKGGLNRCQSRPKLVHFRVVSFHFRATQVSIKRKEVRFPVLLFFVLLFTNPDQNNIVHMLTLSRTANYLLNERAPFCIDHSKLPKQKLLTPQYDIIPQQAENIHR